MSHAARWHDPHMALLTELGTVGPRYYKHGAPNGALPRCLTARQAFTIMVTILSCTPFQVAASPRISGARIFGCYLSLGFLKQ